MIKYSVFCVIIHRLLICTVNLGENKSFVPDSDSAASYMINQFHTLFILFFSDIAPFFIRAPSDTAVTDGAVAVLHCEASGAPKPGIAWAKGK